MEDKADRTRRFSDCEVRIYFAAKRFEDNPCDRMVIEYSRGSQEDVVIYTQNGQRKVGRLRRALEMTPVSSPNIPISTVAKELLESVDRADEERLLAIFDDVKSSDQV